jgi:uncharacterized protein YcfJ
MRIASTVRKATMKKALLAAALGMAVILGPVANAGYGQYERTGVFYDQARVIDVEPIKRTVHVAMPEQECWEEEVRYPAGHANRHNAAGPMIAGGVIGGVVGHQIGRGGAKNTATILGTLIGASVAHDVAAKSAYRRREHVAYEQRCRTVNQYRTEERIDGYWVTYRYRGETYRTRMSYDPGEYLKLRVLIEPARD